MSRFSHKMGYQKESRIGSSSFGSNSLNKGKGGFGISTSGTKPSFRSNIRSVQVSAGGLVWKPYVDADHSYIHDLGCNMVVGLGMGIPMFTCKQDNAPKPTLPDSKSAFWTQDQHRSVQVYQEILDNVTEIVLVVNLKLREDVLIEKCLGRRTCSECEIVSMWPQSM